MKKVVVEDTCLMCVYYGEAVDCPVCDGAGLGYYDGADVVFVNV